MLRKQHACVVNDLKITFKVLYCDKSPFFETSNTSHRCNEIE